MFVSIIGTRPQYIKAAVLHQAFSSYNVPHVVIDTMQHYDAYLNAVHLQTQKKNVKKGWVAKPLNIQALLANIETQIKPHLKKLSQIIVYGDTHSTLAGALVAKKYQIKLVHIEAGERSFNSSMPEEVNRIVVDHLADTCFCVNKKAIDFLKKENVSAKKLMVGDLQYDMFLETKKQITTVFTKPYYFFTLHRAQNTQTIAQLQNIINTLAAVKCDVLWPVHPRVKKMLKQLTIPKNFIVTQPIDYLSTINYVLFSQGVITDSGGLQKEAYWSQVKCITLRPETEWTETLAGGWNTLLPDITPTAFKKALQTTPINKLWNCAAFGNGKAAHKIVQQLIKHN